MRKSKSKYFENRNRFTMTETDSVIENNIPFIMKIAITLSNVSATIGLVFTSMGIVFIGFILPFVGVKSANVPNDSPIVQGEITGIQNTNTEINNRNVLEYHYSYKDEHGSVYNGMSYSHNRNESVGDFVKVRYNEELPEESVIVGMNTQDFPVWVLLFVGIFPLIGVFMLYFGAKKGLKNVKIIQYGKVAFGNYKRREATGSKVNNNTVFKFFFDFKNDDGNTYTATGETHKVHLLEDEPKEPIIYNSTNPEEAVLVDTLPRSVRKFFIEEIEKKKNK